MKSHKFFANKADENLRSTAKAYKEWTNGADRKSECKKHDRYTEGSEVIAITLETFNILIDDENFKDLD